MIPFASENDMERIKKGKAIVWFSVPTCPPCKMIEPFMFSAYQRLKDNAIFLRVNVEENRKIADRFDVINVPTVILFENGVEVGRFDAIRSGKELEKNIEKFVKGGE